MIVGVLLAAGASRRMGSPKPLARDREGSFVVLGIRHLWSACNEVLVVLGAQGRKVREGVEEDFRRLVTSGALQRDFAASHRRGAPGLEVSFVDNPRWRSGMYGSVRFGLTSALAMGPEAILVMPVDQPRLRPDSVVAIATLLRAAIGSCRPKERAAFAYALVPRHKGERGHPLGLSTGLAAAIAKDGRAANLSDAVRRNARLVGYVDVDDPAVVENRNTPRGGRR